MFDIKFVAEFIEWLEHRTKPLFVIVALGLYIWSLIQLGQETNPTTEFDAFLVGALSNLSIPFGIILLQELLELVANIPESNLLSARRQFEIVILVIVRSFFKSFGKVSGYVDDGEFSSTVQESVVKIGAIIIMLLLVFTFQYLMETDYLKSYISGQKANAYKQILVIFIILLSLGYLLIDVGQFEEIEFIRLVFTGIIIVDAVFLLIAIMQESSFASIAFESSLIISLIFARFPLFASNTLSYVLSVIGVGFATASLFLMYRAAETHHMPVDELMDHLEHQH